MFSGLRSGNSAGGALETARCGGTMWKYIAYGGQWLPAFGGQEKLYALATADTGSSNDLDLNTPRKIRQFYQE